MTKTKQEILTKVYKLIELWEKNEIPTLPTQHEVNPGLDLNDRLLWNWSRAGFQPTV
jgi:hypothetical protein